MRFHTNLNKIVIKLTQRHHLIKGFFVALKIGFKYTIIYLCTWNSNCAFGLRAHLTLKLAKIARHVEPIFLFYGICGKENFYISRVFTIS